MNDFSVNNDNKLKKEKSMYILNLDTPRIIIITSIFIGLIVLAVLAGMNIDSGRDGLSLGDNALLDSLTNDNKNPMDNNVIESPLDQGIVLKDIDRKQRLNSPDSKGLTDEPDNRIINDPMFEKSAETQTKNGASTDILTHENIESMLPPVKEAANVMPAKRKKQEIKSAKKHEKKEKKKREKVVEVASPVKKVKAGGLNRECFSIQVASFDQKTKAQNEVTRLESKRFSAFIADALVEGKKYYRVRIGPIFSKEKACELLNEIQSSENYDASYMVKERD